MRWGEFGWVLFLAGLPWSPFLTRPIDLWHSQATWAHGWLIILTVGAIARGIRSFSNHPLAAWVLWSGLSWLLNWYHVMRQERLYPYATLMPWLHVIAIGCFYLAACTWWTRQTLTTLIRWVAISGTVSVLYGYLQLMNLDQFFTNREAILVNGINTYRDVIVGMVGNTSHYAAFLAFLIPCWIAQRQWWARMTAIGAAGLILLAHSTGALVALAGSGLMLAWAWRRWLGVTLLIAAIPLGVLLLYLPEWSQDHGRFAISQHFWSIFQTHPITGMGLGWVMEQSRIVTDPLLKSWRHLHNEFFQVALEQGLIGCSLVLWGLFHAFRRAWAVRQDRLAQTCAAILLAVTLNSLVNWPTHLWVLGSLGLMAYCGIYIVESDATRHAC